MLDMIADFKELGLHGMASAWPEVQGTARIKSLDHETVLMQLIKGSQSPPDHDAPGIGPHASDKPWSAPRVAPSRP